MTELKKIKTAVIGCGAISRIYLVNLKNLFSIIDLVAVSDLNRDAAQATCETFGIEKEMTLEEILADSEIELVVNLTGPAAHYDIIKKCLLAGKHVYSEKMLCYDIEQGRELLRIADEKGLYLGVAPDTFLGAGLQTARKALDADLIGRVTSVVACINRNQLLNSELFGFAKNTGGGFAYDVGIYYVTALLSLLGPVSRVSGFTKTPDTYEGTQICYGNYGKSWDFSGTNSMIASLQFQSGVLGSLHFNGESINEEQPHIAIYGTEGILFVGDPDTFHGPVKLVRNNGENCILPMTHGYAGSPIYGDPTNGEVAFFGHRGLGAAELAWALRAGRTPRASKEMGFHAVEVLCGTDIAAKEGKTYEMTSTFQRPAPLPSGFMNTTFGGMARLDAEASLASD